jgi:hypothetical protein
MRFFLVCVTVSTNILSLRDIKIRVSPVKSVAENQYCCFEYKKSMSSAQSVESAFLIFSQKVNRFTFDLNRSTSECESIHV